MSATLTYAVEDPAQLTAQEIEWLKQHPVIRFAPDPDFAPIEFFDAEGMPNGIAPEYVARVEGILGVRFEAVRCQNWDDVLQKVRDREIDMLSAATSTPDRREYLLFSSPHIIMPGVIIVREQFAGSLSMPQLHGLKVAVVSGYVWHELIAHDYPELDLHPVSDVQTGLVDVALGNVDAMVSTLPVATYYIEQEGIVNLRVAGETGYFTRLSFAVRSDWPHLQTILDKALSRIPEEEKRAIYTKWIRLGQNGLLRSRKFWVTSITVLVGLLAMLGGILAWNRFLTRQVHIRTTDLRNELIERERAEAELSAYKAHLEELVDQRTEELQERSHELEVANTRLATADRLKSEFLANMSHELRTPLNAIIGFAEVLQDGLCGQLNDEQVELTQDIHASGIHLLRIINDILDLSKVESGKMELQPEHFSMEVAVHAVQSIVRDMANRKSLDLQIAVSEKLPDVYADPVRFKQIMHNLLSNAVKFTPERGSIHVDAQYDDVEFVIAVTDTGIGLREEDRESVFEEFRQVDGPRLGENKGTGLGLAVTKRMVELHGGRIWVESDGLNTGCRFCFTLPRQTPDDPLAVGVIAD